MTSADLAFGTDLYSLLAPGSENLVYSPASVSAALSMALLGARGETATELASALRLPGPSAAADQVRALDGIDPGDDISYRAANALWIQSGLRVRPEFLDQPAAIESADFRAEPAAAAGRINQAVAEQTAGKIADLLQPGVVDSLTRLMLVNAVYLWAPWARPFPAADTADAPFYAERGSASTVDMMSLLAPLGYDRGDGWQAVLLPYRGGALAMAIVLPDGPVSSLDVGLVLSRLAGAASVSVRLRLPRFGLRTRLALVPALRSLGVARAFTPGAADFGGITEQEPLHISAVQHQAYIDVAELGTEAAAATGVAMRPLAARRADVTLTVDHPFLFAIVDTASALPLFLGHVSNPASR